MDISAAGITSPAGLVFTATALTGLSGFPGLFLRHRMGLGQKIATLLMLLGCSMGLWGSIAFLIAGRAENFIVNWALPFDPGEVAVDHLTAYFLLPLFLVSACTAVYANGYWPASGNRVTEPKLTFFSGILSASMALVLTARHGVLFLMAWEAMALAAYFTLTAEHEKEEVRKAGFVYLLSTHTGTLALLAMFALLYSTTSSFLFPEAKSLPAGTISATIIFLAALLGFGVKAGIMPLHIWLPAAHANAPSHISAMMSGVMLKMGIYGILRIMTLFTTPPLWWGILVLITGCTSALLGIIFAIAQKDLKKVLAYSSIENIGIITIGAGLALIGLAKGNTTLVTLGMAGALLHVLNHSLFKSLLFMGTGAIIHATGTREIDRMGGLLRSMPATGICFLMGCIAICGFPPLNGFVSEFFLYLGFFSEAKSAPIPLLALGAPLLGVIGGFAAICFMKLYSIVFFGTARTAEATSAHEPARTMLAPLGVLALCCTVGGVAPQLLSTLMYPALLNWAPQLTGNPEAVAALPPLGWLTGAGIALILFAAGLAALLRHRLASTPVTGGVTWDCGYLQPAARMQYTASSFADGAVSLFSGIISPQGKRPVLFEYFPRSAAFVMTIPETLLEQIIVPSFRLTEDVFFFLRRIQLGKIHIYVMYIFVTLVLLLMWAH